MAVVRRLKTPQRGAGGCDPFWSVKWKRAGWCYAGRTDSFTMKFANWPQEPSPASSFLPGTDSRRASRAVPLIVGLLAGGAPFFATLPAARGEENSEAVAISAKARGDYVRTRLADGSIQPETFAFAKGGVWKATEAGTTDMLDFMKVARMIAEPLAGQGYYSSKDPKTTGLLIMVYWGTTHAPEHATDSISSQNLEAANAAALGANQPQIVRFNKADSCAPMQMQTSSTTGYAIRSPAQIDMDNALTGAMAMVAAEDNRRNQINAQNALMLGYDSLWDETVKFDGTPLQYRRQDLMHELEARRYFVVLMAYDFQMLWKEKRSKLLWETRFSIRERGNEFAGELAAMAGSSAPFFGKNNGKLIQKPLPEGHVEVGPIKELASYDHRN